MGNAKRAAEELLAHVMDCKPMEVYLCTGPLSTEQAEVLDALARRVESGEPLQYVIGHVDFMGLEIRCDPRALIPRPETELLVEAMLDSGIWQGTGLNGQPGAPYRSPPRIVDIGTGSGCITLALARMHPEAEYIAVDRSAAALELARENARRLELDAGIQWRESHLLDGFEKGCCDAVVANLPYIATDDWLGLSSAVRDYEPRSALESGPGGMECIEELAARARRVLRCGGMLFLEFGFDQGTAVDRCLHEAGYHDIRIQRDLAGHDRIAIAVNP
jgi:release factor glutamine methyltransferase